MSWKKIIKICWSAIFFIILLKAIVFADEGRAVMEAVQNTISLQIGAF